MKQIIFWSKFLICLIGVIPFISCNDKEHSDISESEDNSLVFERFVLEKKNNPHLNEDIVFEVKNNMINGKLKNYFFNSIPTFSSNAKTVEIDNLEQVSSISSVDFRKSIIYSLKSESGGIKKYTVNISWDDKLAHIYIDTEGGSPIVSKEEYLNTKLTIDGQFKYENRTFKLNQKQELKVGATLLGIGQRNHIKLNWILKKLFYLIRTLFLGYYQKKIGYYYLIIKMGFIY